MDIIIPEGFEGMRSILRNAAQDEQGRQVRFTQKDSPSSEPFILLARDAGEGAMGIMRPGCGLLVFSAGQFPSLPDVVLLGAHAPMRGSYSMRQISQDCLADVCDLAMSRCREFPKFFIVLDLSVVDPAFAPGATKPAPGGLTGREIIYATQRLALLRNCVGAVVGGFDPEDARTADLVLKLLVELANLGKPVYGGG